MKIVFLVCALILSLSAIKSIGDYPKFLAFTVSAGIAWAAFSVMQKGKSK